MAPTTSVAAGFVACLATFGGWFALEPRGAGGEGTPSAPVPASADVGAVGLAPLSPETWSDPLEEEAVDEERSDGSMADLAPLTSSNLLPLIFLPPLALLLDALAFLFGCAACLRRRRESARGHASASEGGAEEAAESAAGADEGTSAPAEPATPPATQHWAKVGAVVASATYEAQAAELRDQLARAEKSAEAREAELKRKVQELEAASQLQAAEAVRMNVGVAEARAERLASDLAAAEEQKQAAETRKAEFEAKFLQAQAELAELRGRLFTAEQAQSLASARASEAEEEARASNQKAEEAEAALREGSATARRAREAEASAAAAQFECEALRAELGSGWWRGASRSVSHERPGAADQVAFRRAHLGTACGRRGTGGRGGRRLRAPEL
eukprot:TRINITY_DN10707_c0_g1_i1.p1 TRINITY_DN10707_c0_g1~~TRINITY_DN10707_c0_g1_i1.p1  ORF type:complete len:416 (+),score=130.48 TRINITY_DN10707_c0_g1_i1:87-1250(+)